MNRLHLFLVFLLSPFYLSAQIIVTYPAILFQDQSVKITFDATKGTADLKDYTGDVYAHTGVITDKSTGTTDWKYVKTAWGTNTPETKLTKISSNIYELNITPDIRTYYGVPATDKILKIALVFRSSDSKKEGKDTGEKDIFADVYENTFVVDIKSPTDALIKEKNDQVIVSAIATQKAALSVYVNNAVIKTLTDTSAISDTITFDATGDYWVKIAGSTATATSSDSTFVCIRTAQETATLPSGAKHGINYIDNQMVTLVLYAPFKQYAYVIGDFTNWLPQNNFQMKKDGDRFWITINNLVPNKEYIFQYLVDGTIRIADPYSDKISDPYDDKYITSDIYPGLIAYPSNKTSERASVLQTAQTPYTWQNLTYTVPEKAKLVIYEMLIRDFTTEGTINAAKAKLPYLKTLGINAIELMPISEFEGNISWGYNPNFYFAPDKAYGTKNDYKQFIDECHKLGIIVIQDIVLNHSNGSSPQVRLYWDNVNSKPAANNPWFNVTSPNTVYSWGYDFNHESAATKQFVDSVNKYWLTEYKIDGFRYDFAKGFTNTPGDGSAFDASRMAILKRMANVVWGTNPNAYVILESFTPNEEEKELAAYNQGMLIWGNSNYNFTEAAKGFHDNSKSDFSWASASSRGYAQPGLVSYMESHDEERVMVNALAYGNTSGSYDIRNKNIAIRRAALASAFFLSIPGPKMIWQFGEMGYDISIDLNGRTGIKPPHWEYLNDTARLRLNKTYRAMLELRKQYPVFSKGTITMSVAGAMKRINLSDADLNVTVIGNFGITVDLVAPNFQHTGTWYEFFNDRTYEISAVNNSILLQPGEFSLYTDKEVFKFDSTKTNTATKINISAPEISIYPNPTCDRLFIESNSDIPFLNVYSVSSQKRKQVINLPSGVNTINTDDLAPGIYMIQIKTKAEIVTKKIIIE